MGRRLKPLTLSEHEDLAKIILQCSDLLSPWLDRLWEAYGVNSTEAVNMHGLLKDLTSSLCNKLDNRWHNIDSTKSSPYYSIGIKHQM